MENLLEISCANCEGRLYRSIGRINENTKLAHKFYCSKFCEYKHKSKKCTVVCENVICGSIFARSPKDVSMHNYCSRSCAAHVNNRKFPKRGPVLKVCRHCEKLIDTQLEYCSQKCLSEERQKCGIDDLIEILKKNAKELGRTPAKREVTESISHACVKLFGSWNNAVVAAGLTANRSHSERMYKRSSARASDGHLCDSISEMVIDNWLTKNRVFHEKNVIYPSTKHRADWSVYNGAIFIEYFGLAEDSPRYDRNIKQKRGLCRKYKIKLIAIYPKDLYPEQHLDGILKDIL